MLKDPASYIPPSKYPMIHQAVLAACDARDGLKDGLIDDPTKCNFDPKVLLCKGADGPSCLTAPQAEAAKKIYSPATNPRTGQELFSSLVPGTELGWGVQAAGPEPSAQHLRSVSLRGVQRSQLGLADFQLRQRRGARRPAGKPGHERHRSQPEAVFLAQRESCCCITAGAIPTSRR